MHHHALAWTATLLWAVTAAGQPPSSPPDTLFGESIEVRVINLHVVAEDANGQRVAGLRPEDFLVEVDGVPTEVRYFTEVRDGAIQPSDSAEQPTAAVGTDVLPNYFLLYVDDNRTLHAQKTMILDRVEAQLPLLRSQDRMAIVVHHGNGLAVLADWTGSQALLRTALDLLRDADTYGGSLRSPLLPSRQRSIRSGFDPYGDSIGASASYVSTSRTQSLQSGQRCSGLAAGCTDGSPYRSGGDASYRSLTSLRDIADRDLETRELELAVASVISTLRGLGTPPGRRLLLMVGGEWPTGAFLVRPEGQTERAISDLEIVGQLADTANLLGYTIYPIDSQPTASLLQWSNLKLLAAATGGRTLVAGLDRQALATVHEDTRSYYWLGISPQLEGRDVSHRVQVRARRPGVRTRSRRGYLDLSRESELANRTLGALLFASGDGGSLSLDVGKSSRAGHRKMRVPVELSIPLDEVALPSDLELDSELEIRFAAVDLNGQQSSIPAYAVRIPAGDRPATWTFDAVLTMRRAPHKIVATVTEVLEGRMLSTHADVRPPD